MRLAASGAKENIEFPSPEINSARELLMHLASDELASANVLSIKVKPLIFGEKDKRERLVSPSHLQLTVTTDTDQPDAILAQLEKIRDRYAANRINDAKSLLSNVGVGEDWIRIDSSVKTPISKSSRPLALGLLGGLVLGSGAALIVDKRSDRVFSSSKILGQLGYPLWITLPSLPWSDKKISPLSVS